MTSLLSFTLPMAMTYVRLTLALAVMPWLVMLSVQSNSLWLHSVTGALCVALCVTDFLDGYYARRYGLVTQAGAFLDQFADKILVTTSLIALVAVHRVHVAWAMVVVVREMLVMGVREYALLRGFTIPVHYAGKVKTTLQYTYLSFVLLEARRWFTYGPFVEYGMLLGMVVATCVSALHYIGMCAYRSCGTSA